MFQYRTKLPRKSTISISVLLTTNSLVSHNNVLVSLADRVTSELLGTEKKIDTDRQEQQAAVSSEELRRPSTRSSSQFQDLRDSNQPTGLWTCGRSYGCHSVHTRYLCAFFLHMLE